MKITMQDLSKRFKQSTAIARKNKKEAIAIKNTQDEQERNVIKEAEKLKNEGWNFHTES
jgi:hypothetical protein